MKRLLGIFLVFVTLILFLGACLAAGAWYFNSPPASLSSGPVAFTIMKGESLQKVAERLEDKGLIRSSHFLVLLSKLLSTEKLFQAGSYLVPPGKSTTEVHEFFTTGSQALVRVTIPEGWTAAKIADYLEKRKITGKADFLAAAKSPALLHEFGVPGGSLEGYLFPDTYLFPEDFPAEKTVSRMTENFFEKLGKIYPEYRGMSQKELRDKIILASIIEREYRSEEEAPLMASVFYNRLKVNMALGSCATVEYIITEINGRPHPDFLTFQDLEIPSDYNTYRHAGLPPGPISNPGTTALKASFEPAKTDYWYFVLRDPATGRHFFSKSLQEHNQAKVVYLKKVSQGS